MLEFALSFLVALIFISKWSFEFLGFVPSSFSQVVFQHGMHPQLHAMLLVLVAVGLILFARKYSSFSEQRLSVPFKIFKFFAMLSIGFMSVLQLMFSETLTSSLIVMGAAQFALLLWLYAGWIPEKLSVNQLTRQLKFWTYLSLVFSSAVLLLRPDIGFHGNRFVGVFKHIPHLVTCASLACFFSAYAFFNDQSFKKKFLIKGFEILIYFAALYFLYLSGTRSSLFICALIPFWFWLKAPSLFFGGRLLKLGLALPLLTAAFLLGPSMATWANSIIRGQTQIGDRLAQDGIEARQEEWRFGLELVAEAPWIGHGILGKFGNSDEGGLGTYSSQKDPHNYIASAAVIGGWPLSFLAIIAFLGLTGVLVFKVLLWPSSDPKYIFAVFLLAHTPVLFVYHLHLSAGGFADRIYWLFLAITCVQSATEPRAAKWVFSRGAF